MSRHYIQADHLFEWEMKMVETVFRFTLLM
jgi:hypothetical protein